MGSKITLEQLTTFINTKTDLSIQHLANKVKFDKSTANINITLVIEAIYENESFLAICNDDVDSLLNLIVKIFIAHFEDDQDKYLTLTKYLRGKERETYNALSALSDKLNELPYFLFRELSFDEFKEKPNILACVVHVDKIDFTSFRNRIEVEGLPYIKELNLYFYPETNAMERKLGKTQKQYIFIKTDEVINETDNTIIQEV